MPPSDPLAARLAGRPGWQVLALAAAVVVVALLAVVLVVTLAAETAPLSPLPPRLHRAAVGLPAVLALYALARRLLLRAPASWFLVGRPDRAVLWWCLVGVVLATLAVVGNLWVVGADPVVSTRSPLVLGGALAVSLAGATLAATLEELAFRGALLRLLEARWGPAPALGGTAATFAVLHQGHARGATELALVLASMLAAGLLLGTVALGTRSAWNAAGVHAGWNAVFGGRLVDVAPPGLPLDDAALALRLHDAPTWLTGGGATLGSAPLTTALLLVATAAVWRALAEPAGGRP